MKAIKIRFVYRKNKGFYNIQRKGFFGSWKYIGYSDIATGKKPFWRKLLYLFGVE